MKRLESSPRLSGLILHPTALPGRFGIGDLGEHARRFVDFLAECDQHLWQMLPLGPPHHDDWFSPYSAYSAFAGSPLLLSLEQLREEGMLTEEQLAVVPALPEGRVDFQKVVELKGALLSQASLAFRERASPALQAEFERFQRQEQAWLEDYALFMALRQEQGPRWSRWEEAPRRREPQALAEARRRLADAIFHQKYLQFEFYRQWSRLKRYANERGVLIVGDLPIYVAHESADVWRFPEYFQLEPDTLGPALQAGVPPDVFNADGQLWGNPVYDWKRLEADDYQWWAERLRQSFKLFDFVRIDHFRGFEAYWVVPSGASGAKAGRWEKGPASAFFAAMRRHLRELPIIVEDLGYITPDVHALREEFGFPGMCVLQFAFDGERDNPYLPYKCRPGSVIYTGTHDTATTAAWFQSLAEPHRRAVLDYLGAPGAHGPHWDMLRLAWASVAQWSLAPLQDVLGLGDEGRMNHPGTANSGNWSWRFRWDMLDPEAGRRLASLTRIYGRAPARP